MTPTLTKSLLFAVTLLLVLLVLVGRSEIDSKAAGSSCQTPSFAVVQTGNIGNSLYSLAVGDINGDSKPDVVTAGYYEDRISFLLGDGAGNFSLAGSTTSLQRPSEVALGDFNQDGKLDLVVTADFSSSVYVLLGTGTGSFSAPVFFAVGNNPLSLVLADFNNDGKLDIATGNDGSNTISILLGNGAGNFTAAPGLTNVRPRSLAVADLNHDNKLDIAAANDANGKVTIFLGDGGGGFGAATHFEGGFALQAIAAADFNGDTHPDIAVTNYSDCCTPAFVAVLLGNGNGSFGAPTKFSAPYGPYSIAIADYNGDGKADVATANIQQTSSNVAVLLGDGAGALGAPTTFNPGAAPWAVVAHDINLDGVPDIVAASPPRIAALLNACGGAPTPTPTPTPTPSPTPVASPTPALGDVVISQIYSGGGQPGSTYQHNYIELFNRSNEVIDITSWPITAASATGTYNFSLAFVGSSGVYIGPGQHLLIQMGPVLIQMGPASTNGAPLPVTPDFTISQNIELSGRLSFSRAGIFLSGACPTLPHPDIMDYVGYGAASTCFEGAGPVANLSTTTAALRLSDGCTDTNNNASDFVLGAPNPRNGRSTPNFCSSDPPKVQLTQSVVTIGEGGTLGLVVTRTGNTSLPTTVDYTTSDTSGANSCNIVSGHASARCDYIAATGTLHFEPYETYKQIFIRTIDDTYAEGSETFSVSLSNLSGGTFGPRTSTTVTINDNDSANGLNAIDGTGFFVRQQYLDFLNREPDSFGYSFWFTQINNCTPKPDCTEIKRINVSAAFFLSIEFQESGYLAYRAYKSAYGDGTGQAVVQGASVSIPVPIIRHQEFLADSHAIGHDVVVGETGWQTKLESNKVAYFLGFVTRQRFLTDYPQAMSAAEFVDKLNLRAGNVLSNAERDTLVNQLQSGQKTRAEVFRAVSEDGTLAANESNRAFVLMQYFGYLRRNPNDLQDSDYSGYKFWLDKLNLFNGNSVQAEMVKAFINSSEYRQRFGP